MRTDEAVLRVVEHLAVIAAKEVECGVLAAPGIAKALTISVVADLCGEGVDNRILFVAPIAFHNYVIGVDG